MTDNLCRFVEIFKALRWQRKFFFGFSGKKFYCKSKFDKTLKLNFEILHLEFQKYLWINGDNIHQKFKPTLLSSYYLRKLKLYIQLIDFNHLTQKISSSSQQNLIINELLMTIIALSKKKSFITNLHPLKYEKLKKLFMQKINYLPSSDVHSRF